MTLQLKPCPFCAQPLSVSTGFNPIAQCETEGCWLRERKIGIAVEDPTQVAAWNRRISA